MEVTLEQREADLATAHAVAEEAAAAWLEARASDHAARADASLDDALRELRAAERRHVKTEKRLRRRS